MHGFLVNLGKINNKAIWRNCWFLNRSFIIYMFRHLYLYMLTRLRNAPNKLYFVFRKKTYYSIKKIMTKKFWKPHRKAIWGRSYRSGFNLWNGHCWMVSSNQDQFWPKYECWILISSCFPFFVLYYCHWGEQ